MPPKEKNMIGTLLVNKSGRVENTVSSFQPSTEVAELSLHIKKDYERGMEIQHRPFREFNDLSLLQRMDIDQKIYNIWVQQASQNPDDAWRWPGVRPMTHNKVLAMAAHFIAATLFPNVFAQNSKDEQDKLAAEVMKYIIEWNIRNSDYEISYMFLIFSALVNPIAYLQAEFLEVMQEIKMKHEDGTIGTKEAVDDIMSGFKANNIPADEILIANPYQYYIQKQRFIIRKKYIDYDEAESIYGQHENWKYIKPGIKVFYDGGSSTFYEQKDEELETLCEVVVYKNRREDLEVPFINGIYFGKTDVKANLIKHLDAQGKPKYNIAKLGFQPVDEKNFFFYRSLVMNNQADQSLLDKMWRMTMDGTFLKLFKPMIGVGTGKIGANIIYPGSFTNLLPNADIRPLDIGSDLGAGINAIKLIENSIDEGSITKTLEGQINPEARTKWELQRAEINSRIQLSIFGKMIIQFVKDFGELMIETILQHETVGEIQEMLAGSEAMKFRTFILPDQKEEGKTITRKIRFNQGLMGRTMTEEEHLKESFRIMKEQGGKDGDMKIYEINPDLFPKLKFKITIDADALEPKNQDVEQQKAERAYMIMRKDPLFNQMQVARDLADAYKGGESDKYMAKEASGSLPMPAMGKSAEESTPLRTLLPAEA